MLKLLAKFLRILNSETDPVQISIAFCLGMVAGLTPLMSVHNLVVLLLVLVLRANLTSFIAATLLFSGVAYVFDPVLHRIGMAVLGSASLKGLFTGMYNMPIMRVARFNNTIVMGSVLTTAVLVIPAFFIFTALINVYRARVIEWVKKSRLAQMIAASKFYKLYETVSTLRGN